MKLPDREIRKAISQSLSGTTVISPFGGGELDITVHDFRPPENKSEYVLMINQWADLDRETKCPENTWNCGITLDIVTKFPNTQGSRLLADIIQEEVWNLTRNLEVDGFHNEEQTMRSPDDLETMTSTENIYRKLIQYEFKLIEKN